MGNMGPGTGFFLAKKHKGKKYRVEMSALYWDVFFCCVFFLMAVRASPDGVMLNRPPNGVVLRQYRQFPTAYLTAVIIHDPGYVLVFDPARDH